MGGVGRKTEKNDVMSKSIDDKIESKVGGMTIHNNHTRPTSG